VFLMTVDTAGQSLFVPGMRESYLRPRCYRKRGKVVLGSTIPPT
jgi:hypothetical protein